MISAWAVAAALFWMVLGAFIALVCVLAYGRAASRNAVEIIAYGAWLGKACEARFGDEWRACRIVAVSHKGAVAVRGEGGWPESAVWIPKNKVAERVRSAGEGLRR